MIGRLISENPQLIDGDIIPADRSNYENYTPINKGHFDLDTNERRVEFENKLSEGWEKDYADYRKKWIELGKKRIVRDYPLLVDLELSSICNLHCPMCYTTTEEYLNQHKELHRDAVIDNQYERR